MTPQTICFTGFPKEDTDALQGMLAAANGRFAKPWQLAGELEAAVLVIDMDSMYGHMSWLKAHNSGKKTIGVTMSPRSETDHLLARPVTADALAAVLGEIAGQQPAAKSGPRSDSPEPSYVAKPAPAPEPAKVTTPAPAMAAPRSRGRDWPGCAPWSATTA
jgi:hypothetical protein